MIHKDALFWVSAGDSRVYLWRSNQLTRLTEDHVLAVELSKRVKDGELTAESALVHPERESLTSYLGLDFLPKVEKSIRPFPLGDGDWALICSDGLYRALSEDEMATSLQNDPQRSCDVLIERALAKENPSQDNVTVLALKFHQESRGHSTTVGRFGKMAIAGASAVMLAILVLLSLRFWRPSPPGGPTKPSQVPTRAVSSPPRVGEPPKIATTKTSTLPPLTAKPATPPPVVAGTAVAPAIQIFTATKKIIKPGESTKITWKVSGSPRSIAFYRDNSKTPLPDQPTFTITP